MAKDDLIDQLIVQTPEHNVFTCTFLLDVMDMPHILSFWFLVYLLYYLTFNVSVELNLAKWNICPKTFFSISFNPYFLVLVAIYLLYQRDRLKIPQNSYGFLCDTVKTQNPNFPIFFPNLIIAFTPFANHVSYIFLPFCLLFFFNLCVCVC